MHYKNGREAKNGDKVMWIPPYEGYTPTIGILFNAKAGNDYCNGTLLPLTGPCPNLKECLHLDDVLAIIPPDVPDQTAPPTNTAPTE